MTQEQNWLQKGKATLGRLLNTRGKKLTAAAVLVLACLGIGYFWVSSRQQADIFAYYDQEAQTYQLVDSDFNRLAEDMDGQLQQLAGDDNRLLVSDQYYGNSQGVTIYQKDGKNLGSYALAGSSLYYRDDLYDQYLDQTTVNHLFEGEDVVGPKGEINVVKQDDDGSITSGFVTDSKKLLAETEDQAYVAIFPDDAVLTLDLKGDGYDPKYGLSDVEGDELVKAQYGRLTYLSPNRYAAQKKESDTTVQIIDRQGKVVKDKVKVGGPVVGRLSKNLVLYTKGDAKSRQMTFGLLNTDLEEVVKAEFTSIPIVTETGEIAGITGMDNTVKIYDKTGKKLKSDSISAGSIAASHSGLIPVITGRGYGLINSQGKVLLEKETKGNPLAAWLSDDGKGLIVSEYGRSSSDNGLTVYIVDQKGKKVSKTYESGHWTENGTNVAILTKKNGAVDAVDSQGKVVAENAKAIGESVTGSNLLVRQKDGKFAIVSPSGQVLKKASRLKDED